MKSSVDVDVSIAGVSGSHSRSRQVAFRGRHRSISPLIKAVVILHKASVLRCDIKPGNVVWDRTSKVASLVDFGHAEKEEGALSYVGTEGSAYRLCKAGKSAPQLSF
jgi:serine/threonine protein kinase